MVIVFIKVQCVLVQSRRLLEITVSVSHCVYTHTHTDTQRIFTCRPRRRSLASTGSWRKVIIKPAYCFFLIFNYLVEPFSYYLFIIELEAVQTLAFFRHKELFC